MDHAICDRAPRNIAFFGYSLSGGGSQRRTLALARGVADRGHRVDLVVINLEGPLRSEVPDSVRLVELKPWLLPGRSIIGRKRGLELRFAIPALASYLRRTRPEVLLAAASHVIPTAIQAHRLARVPTALVLRVSNSIGETTERGAGRRPGSQLQRIRRLYPRADAIVAVSQSVAEGLEAAVEETRGRIETVYNPVWDSELIEKAAAPLDHPWFAPAAPPVILGVGRLSPQKDFPTLLRAFSHVRTQTMARLMILGGTRKAERREQLVELARQLGLGDDFALPGFVDNPLPYMARSAVFALSSIWEGLPGVLIEALASGCPVVSTDCPGGSREILENGRWGPLVKPRDPEALGTAILKLLEKRPPAQALRDRAAYFGVDRAVDGYLSVFEAAIARRRRSKG
jgi:glycosyltransferase involved in cell wall biosynthesis